MYECVMKVAICKVKSKSTNNKETYINAKMFPVLSPAEYTNAYVMYIAVLAIVKSFPKICTIPRDMYSPCFSYVHSH